jgi:2-polyprenyl-3-methyl-5-hydroxy-6-metoxy-1,4-benzoquinol methylase
MLSCYFCSSNNFKKIDLTLGGAVFYECLQCSLITLPKEDRPKAKEHYSSVYYSSDYSGRKNLEEAFYYRLPLITRFVKSGAKILEVGAASGDFLHILQESGYEINGVELSSRAVEKARQNYNISIKEGTLAQGGFQDDFEAILMYHVLEHVDDPRALLKEAFGALRSDGVVVIEVPNPKSIDRFSKKLLGSILDYPNHCFAFPPCVLKSMLKEAGFEVIFEQSSFSYLITGFVKNLLRSKSNHIYQSPSLNTGSYHQSPSLMKRRSFLKELASHIFPGMKYTVVAQKR